MNREDVKAKTDEELLSIFARQHDYVAGALALVKEEIEARHLDTSQVQAPTAEQLQEAEGARASRSVKRSARFLGFLEFVVSLFFLLPGLASFSRQPVVASGLVFLGAIMLTLAVFSWLVHRWALLANAIGARVIAGLTVGPALLEHWGRIADFRPSFWVGAGIYALAGLVFFQTWRDSRPRP